MTDTRANEPCWWVVDRNGTPVIGPMYRRSNAEDEAGMAARLAYLDAKEHEQ